MATVEFLFQPEMPVADTEPRPKAERSPPTEELRDMLRWHGAWAAGVAVTLAVLMMSIPGMTWTAAGALLAGGAPGAAGLLLGRRDSPRRRATLLAFWAVCTTIACMLAGGIAGPLAVWCLAPVAAATAFGGSSLLAEAAALSLAAAAISALASLAGFTPPQPAATLDFWLGFIGLVTTGAGLGSGLLLAKRRTDRGRAQRKAAETGLERLLSDQPYLILSLDPLGKVLSAFGFAPEGVDGSALPGRRLRDLAEGADRTALETALAAALVTGAGECVFSVRGAPERVFALALRRDSEGRLAGVLRDATAQAIRISELEIAREEAESLNAGKSRFLANMSHELRTPLNAVIGFSDVMRAKLFGELPPKYAEYAEMIHDAGRHLLDLINDVLDISKIEAERYQLSRDLFDARDAVSGALRLTRLQADEAGISLRGLLPPQPLEAEADSRAIKQIVLNLISNALKFTPRGGSVTVTANGFGEDLEIVVSDTGVGIAEADLQRLGRPYEQAGDASHKILGAGLGLSLVRSFAELHGGSMSIESRLGEGTSVMVRMPVLKPDQAALEASHSAKVIAFNPQR